MIEYREVPRHPTLFEFCKEHKLPLVIEKGEHAFKKPYTRLCIPGYTGYYYYSGTQFREIDFEEESLQAVTIETIDYMTRGGLYVDKKLVLKVPTLSYSTDGHEGFDVVQGPRSVALFDWVEKENLTLVISTGWTVKGKPFVRAEFEEYGIVGSHCGNGEVLTLAIEDTERLALKELAEKISEKYIAPQYYKSGWSRVDETKKIKVPALYV